MLTTDFTGTYDYEKEEAEHAARYILDSVYDGDLTADDLPETLLKERTHWKKCIPETFEDWDAHFTRAINEGLEHALKGAKHEQI